MCYYFNINTLIQQILDNNYTKEELNVEPSLLIVNFIEHLKNNLNKINENDDIDIKTYLTDTVASLVNAIALNDSTTPLTILNLRLNLGLLSLELQDSLNLSFIEILSNINKSSNITPANFSLFNKLNREAHHQTTTYSKILATLWFKLTEDGIPDNTKDHLKVIGQMILLSSLSTKENNEYYLDSFYKDNPFCSNLPLRDYSKGYEFFMNTFGREQSIEKAKAFFGGDVPDNVSDKAKYIKLIDEYYYRFESALEPWRWDHLKDATVEDKALVWAWLTQWCPDYNWNKTLINMGIHQGVEQTFEELTGHTQIWWSTSSFEEKFDIATKFITDCMTQVYMPQNNDMDDFLNFD